MFENIVQCNDEVTAKITELILSLFGIIHWRIFLCNKKGIIHHLFLYDRRKVRCKRPKLYYPISSYDILSSNLSFYPYNLQMCIFVSFRNFYFQTLDPGSRYLLKGLGSFIKRF